ncbi:NAD(P)H-dependent oxidoreductase [Ulvibacterium marinum]|uniref:NAD(P)H-dependent oxidoreductase n=1 Tax=Ulvibacterium marinum TaxID=2419782 RepID=A0A3B0C9X4_9FLAO|nr:NAD(P)H-dependent oxidoreductase [Ulvibacterium marinum]RKN81344.1 NAD(P)H-dependent oxidoreductase [Ulvibacterium marinum]
MSNSIENLEWRYAVKKFDHEKVLSQEKVELLKQAFNLTATSYGLQPIRMVVLKDKDLQKQLVSHSFGQQQVAQASHVLVICIESVINTDFIKNYFKRVKKIRNTPDEVLEPYLVALLDDFSQKKTPEIQQWCINQAYLSMGNLLTVCAMEKIDSCPMEGFNPEGYDKLLELPEKGLNSVLVLPVGYRAKDDMFSGFKKVRKKMDDSIIEIF